MSSSEQQPLLPRGQLPPPAQSSNQDHVCRFCGGFMLVGDSCADADFTAHLPPSLSLSVVVCEPDCLGLPPSMDCLLSLRRWHHAS